MGEGERLPLSSAVLERRSGRSESDRRSAVAEASAVAKASAFAKAMADEMADKMADEQEPGGGLVARSPAKRDEGERGEAGNGQR